jgi:PAS domain S-box-containing protein
MNTRIVWKDWGRAAVLAAVYLSTAKLGLLVAIPPGNATAVWVPSGVALVAMLLLGYRVWPVIWFSAMLVNATTNISLATAAIIGLGNTSEALLGVYLLRRLDVANRRFTRAQDVFRFLAVAGIASTVASIVGVGSLGLGGRMAWSDAAANWLTWWLGDTVGIVLVTPLLLAWRDRSLLPQDRRLVEALGFFVLLLVVGQLILGGWLPIQTVREMVYVFLVFLIWAAFRFGQREVTTAIVVMSGIAIWATVHGAGPFSETALNSSLLSLQAFMGIMAATGLTLTAVVDERKAAATALQQVVEKLEERMQERTSKLERSNGALLQEIAERRRAEEALRQNESFLDSLYRLMPVGVCLIDERGRFVQVNDTYCAIYGYARHELIGQPCTRIMPDEEMDATSEIYAQLLGGNTPSPSVRTRVRKDGSVVYVQAAVALWSKENGERLIITGVIDVTERKRAEQALQTRADEFYRALDTSPDSINISRLEDGLYIEVNDGFTRLTGYTRSDVIGKTSLDVGVWVHPEERAQFVQILKERGEVQDFEAELRRKEGIIRIGAMSARTIEFNGERCMLNITRDITERELAQEALRLSEEKFNKAFHTSPDSVTISRLNDGQFVDVNDGFMQLTGYTQSEVIGTTAIDLGIWVSQSDRDTLTRGLQEHGEVHNLDWKFRRKDGEIRDGLMSARIIEIDGEDCILAIVHDVTERKRAEEALRLSEEKFNKAFHTSPDAISISRLTDGMLLDVNDGFTQFTGYTRSEAIGQLAVDIGIWIDPADRPRLVQALREYGEARNFEWKLRRKDGEIRIGSLSARPIEISGEACILAMARDITEHKRTEEALRLSEEKFTKAFYTSPYAITINRLEDGAFLDVNDGFTQLTGYTRSEAIGKTTLDLGIWVDPTARVGMMQSLHERGEAQNIEAQFRRRNGEIRIGLLSAKSIEISGERCFLAIVHDITDRKRAEEALRELSQLHQEIISGAGEGIIVYDHQLRYVVWNKYMEELTCIPAAQIIGTNVLENFPDVREQGIRTFLERALAGETVTAPDITIQPRGSSRVGWLSSRYAPHRNAEGDIVGVIGVAREVTERKLAEEALRQSEAAEREQRILAEALRDSAAALTGTLDPNEVMTLILENVGRVAPHDAANIELIEGNTARVVYQHGYTSDRPPRLAPFSLDDSPTLRRMIETGAPTFIADVASEEPGWPLWPEIAWLRSYAGSPLQVHGVIIGFLNLDSATPGFYSAVHAERLRAFADQAAIAIENAQLYDELRHRAADLERRVVERTAELDQERAQLRTILDSMAEGVAYIDLENGTTRYVNRAFSSLTGYTPEESVGQSMDLYQTIVKPPEMLSGESHATMLRTIGQGRVWSTEVKMRRWDGSEFDASLTVTNVPGSESRPRGAVVLVRDIGQEKALQEQKDRFIASASHELRTPVTNLKMRLYLARRQPDQMAEHLVALERATDQLVRLIESMLDISRFERGVILLNRQVVVLQDLVRAVIADQRPRAEAKQLRLASRVAATPIHVHIDPDRLKQAIDNLVVNAINYTPEGGRVLVQLRIEQHDSVKCATVRVRDTGIGIAPEALPRIFEPFYRAVETAIEGTGLGLTISREIIELHGGTISVESQVGKGSTFSIRLPLEPATG